MKAIGKFFFKLVRTIVVIYAILFAVFYWDLDGKFLYYIWEPLMIKRFDNMKRDDTLKTPYTMKDNVE